MTIFCPKCMNTALEAHAMGYRCPECDHVMLDSSDVMLDVLDFYATGGQDGGKRARMALGRDKENAQ